MKLHCDIQLPASKSESNRALMIAAYGRFAPDFQNLSESKDTQTLLDALRGLPPIDSIANPLTNPRNDLGCNPHIIDIADCGTAARFMTTYLACKEGKQGLYRHQVWFVCNLRMRCSCCMYLPVHFRCHWQLPGWRTR